MLSVKYRIIERAGMYRAQWSRLGLSWTDIGWSQNFGAYDANEDGYTFLVEQRARDAIKDHQQKRATRAMPWRVVDDSSLRR